MRTGKSDNHWALDSKSTGLHNELLILSLLRRFGPSSQTQLRQRGQIGSSTVSYIVRRLREKALILEETGQSNSRGAKPVLLRINPKSRYVVGVEISPSYVYLGLFDFTCSLVESVKAALGPDNSPEHVVGLLEINLRGLLGKHNISEDRLLGIGVTLSGSISVSGVVELSSPLSWKKVPLGEMLVGRFQTPVSVHTTRVRLLAEDDNLGQATVPRGETSDTAINVAEQVPAGMQNVFYLHVGNGVGGHVIIDGKLAHGATNRSAELGHVVVDPQGPLCGCGLKGCLETLVSGPALARRIIADIDAGRETLLSNTIRPSDIPEDIVAKWGQAVAKGDDYALELRNTLGDYLGKIAAVAINCYDPELVILAGYVSQACMNFFIQAIQRRMSTDVYDYTSRNIRVVPARCGQESLIRGVAKAVVQSVTEIA